MKKLLILALLFFLAAPFANAAPTGGSLFWNMNDTLLDQWGVNNGTATGAVYSTDYPTFNISGDGGAKSIQFNGINQWVDGDSENEDANKGADYSISLWAKLNTTSAHQVLLTNNQDANDRIFIAYNPTGGGEISFSTFDGVATGASSGAYTTANSWVHIVATYTLSGTVEKLYLNTTLQGGSSYYGGAGGQTLRLGAASDGTLDLNGSIDEVKIFNYTLNQTEINNLFNYNNIAGLDTVSNFTITCQNVDGDTLNNCTAYIEGDENYSTTNGTIVTNILDNSTQLWNITIGSDDYINRSYTNYNVTSDLTAELHQATIELRSYEKISGNNISTFEIDLSATTSTGATIEGDTFTHSDNPSTNYGSNTNLYTQTSTSSGNMRSYFYINITSADSGLDYYLQHYIEAVQFASSSVNIEYYYCNDTMNESNITWNNQDTEVINCDGTPFHSEVMTDLSTGWQSVSISDQAHDDADGLFIIRVVAEPEDYSWHTRQIRMSSTEDGSTPPYVSIEGSNLGTYNTTTGVIGLNTTLGSYNYNWTHPPGLYFDESGLSFVAANATQNISLDDFGYVNLSILAVDALNGSSIATFTANITSLNYTLWTGEETSTTTNITSFTLINGTYNVTVDVDGYSYGIQQVNITAYQQNLTIYLQPENALNISIYKESTNTLLSGINFTIDIITANDTINLTTDNGTHWVEGLAAGEVEIRYAEAVNNSYEGRVYFVNLTDRSYHEIRLYLLNSTISDLITLDLIDQNGDDLEGAIIKAQRFYPAENLYRTVAMTKSNFNGQGSIDLVKKTTQANIFYKFIVEVGGVVREETEATEINPVSADILYFTIQTQADVFESWDAIDDVSGSLTFDETTNRFSFVWSDTTGLVRQGCLQVIRQLPNREIEICDSCTESTSATILCSVNDTGDFYLARAFIDTTTENSEYTVATLTHSFFNRYETFGDTGVFLAFIFVLTMAGVGIWNPIVAGSLAVVAVIFSVLIGFVYLSWASIISLIIIGGILWARSKT